MYAFAKERIEAADKKCLTFVKIYRKSKDLKDLINSI